MPYPPPNTFSEARLDRNQASAYLTRIALPTSMLDESPSLEQLSQIQLSHLEQVPKDTTPLHVSEEQWTGPNIPIKLSTNFPGMPVGVAAYERIVEQNKGAFCFSVNAVFATLLRTLGYRVSELGSRAYKALGNDPKVHEAGWLWGAITHEVLIVDWPGSEERYLVDAMWGPWSLAKPIKLVHGETIQGLNRFEAYQLLHEPLPQSPGEPKPIDSIDGWTLYRRITPKGTPITLPIDEATTTPGAYWSPLFYMLPISLPVLDFSQLHFYSAYHSLASFTAFWLVTKLIPGGGGSRLSMMYTEREGDEEKKAKVYITGGEEAQGSEEGREVRWVSMETEPMKEFLQKEFGYKF